MLLMMRIKRILSTAVFRLTVVFMLIFCIGSLAMLAVLNMAVVRFAEKEIEDALYHQMAIMRADVTLEGGAALANVLKEHSRTDAIGRYSYRVVLASGEVFSNGLDDDVTQIVGLTQTGEHPGRQMMIFTERAPDGTFMAVGRDISSFANLRAALREGALWGGLGMIVLSVLTSGGFGFLLLQRIDSVNAAAMRVVDSNLSTRLPSIGFGREFTELAMHLNRMLDRLEDALTAFRQVSADIAHDMRSPLTRLRNHLEEAMSHPTEGHHFIQAAIVETDEILGIFTTMLRIAQVESGSQHQSFSSVDIAEIAARLTETYGPSAEQSGHLLALQVTGRGLVQGEPTLLQQLMSNLIDNVLLHTPSGTRLEIVVHSTASEVILSLSDNGRGVPEEELTNITKRFYRLDASRGTPGVGLGLPLVVAIARLHNARFDISNRPPGLQVKLIFRKEIRPH